MPDYYYTFEIAGQHIGYSLLQITDAQLYSETKAQFGEIEIDNRFTLRLAAGAVVAFTYNGKPWVEMADFPENSWPSSAYPLLLEKARPTFAYVSVNEDSAEVSHTLKLVRTQNTITEYSGEQAQRTFWLDSDERIVKIDWGGAVSVLCNTLEEATAGTPFARL